MRFGRTFTGGFVIYNKKLINRRKNIKKNYRIKILRFRFITKELYISFQKKRL